MPSARDISLISRMSNDEVNIWTYGDEIIVPALPQYSVIAGEKVNPMIEVGSTYKITITIKDDTDNGKGDIRFQMLGQSWQLSGSPVKYERVITATDQMTRISEARRDSASANSIVNIKIVKL